jgi:O-antigen/teichoic acid export membrane protein
LSNHVLRVPRLVANFAVLSGGEFLSKLFALAAFAYLARVLGPGDFGQLEFALAVIFLFTLLVDCGLSPYGAREIAKNKSAVTRFTAHIILIRCLLAVGAFVLLAILVTLINKPWPIKKLLLLYGLTLLALPGLLQFVFQGCDLMRHVAVASLIRWSLFAAGIFLLIRKPDETWIVPLIEGSAIGCAVVFYLTVFSHYFGSLRQRIDSTFAFSIFRQALPIGASELVWALKIYFATVLLGILVGGPEVGWFGAAHRIVISLHTFVWLYFFNLLPAIARSTQGPVEALHRLTKTSMQVTAWSAVFLGIVGTAFAEPIITLIYGSQYHEAVAAFRVLIWLVPLALMSGHYHYALIAYNRQKLHFLSTACGAGLNVLLNLFLIPGHGFLGAAWALLISEVFIWSLAYYFVRRTITHVPIWSSVSQPLVGGAIFAGALYLLPPINIWMAGASAVVVYCLVLSVIQPKIFAHLRSIFVRNQ